MEGTIGEMRMFAGNFAPRAWAFCDGQLLSIASNTALFSIIGTTYGGDGRTTFALPDMRSRVAMHAGTGPGLSTRRIGQRFGLETSQLTNLNLPNHNHTASGTVKATSVVGTERVPTGNNLAGSSGDFQYTGNAANVNMADGNVAVTIGNTGDQRPFNNIQPVGVVNYIICLQGIFPSRS